jgi:DNA-binding winged helix-turn-helix (wHTH) protein/Tfp pilus assembly protein PilF/TolB-like protein
MTLNGWCRATLSSQQGNVFFDGGRSGMQAPANPKRSYRFGLFQVDLASREVLRQGIRVRLQDQPFRLLTVLLEQPGEIVSREELRQRLWPADTYVEFDGSLNAALKRLRSALGDPADNPIFIETVPKRGYRFIAPVKVQDEKLAGSRPEPEAPVVPAITAAAPPVAPSPSGTRSRSLYVYGASVALAILSAFGWYFLRHRPRHVSNSSSAQLQSVSVRKSIAILGFYNASGRSEDQWLSTAFSEMLSTELASGERLRLVPGEEIANLHKTTPWPQTSALSPATTATIGSALNSDLLVSGSYTSIGSGDRTRLRLDVCLQDSRTGEVLTQIAETASSDELFRITTEIGSRLRERMGIPGVEDADEAGVLASLPLNHEAARFYALGIARLRQFDALAAKDLLQQACEADPKFSLGHAMLARAWAQLGYEQKRKEEAKKALDLSIDLPRMDRLQVEGDYYSSLPDFEKASSSYRALFELFPDSVDYGLQLANTQNAAGHQTQAIETLERLRRLPEPASQDARIDIAEARIGWSKVNSLSLLQTALAKAAAHGQKLLYASARLEQCRQLVYSEHPVRASDPCQEAYTTYLAAGNNLQAANALALIADQQGGQGHVDQARLTYQQALKILQGLGEHFRTGAILNNMAIGYTNEGNLVRGEQLYREAKFHFEQAGDRIDTATTLSNIADIDCLRGNLAAAEKAYNQAIELEASSETANPVYGFYRMADVELIQGRVAEAHRLASKAVEMAGSRADRHPAIAELGDVLLAEGDLEGARRQYENALQIREAQGRAGEVADAQQELSELALDDAHPDQAKVLLHSAIAEYEKEKQDPGAAAAYILLSRASLMQGDMQAARQQLQHAVEIGRNVSDPAFKFSVAIQGARVDAAEFRNAPDAASRARRELRAVIESAANRGYHELEFEARLALCELDVNVSAATGRSACLALAKEAKAQGLGLIAEQAMARTAGADAIATSARK